MYPPHGSSIVWFLCKCFLTNITLVWSLPGVCTLMHTKAVSMNESSFTIITFERFLTCVNPHVRCEVTCMIKRLFTKCTWVWLFFCVSSQMSFKVCKNCKLFSAYIDEASPLCEFSYVLWGLSFAQSSCHFLCVCVVSLLCALLSEPLVGIVRWNFFHILRICEASPLCELLCGNSVLAYFCKFYHTDHTNRCLTVWHHRTNYFLSRHVHSWLSNFHPCQPFIDELLKKG